MKTEVPARRRLPIAKASAAILAIVAALVLAQRLREFSHRYDQFDFVVFYGWWSDYSSGGDPWTDLQGHMRGCNYTPVFVEGFSPLARLDQKTAFRIWQTVQVLCIFTAVLLVARGNAPPLGGAPTIIVLSLVLMSRPFASALAWSQIAPMLLALLCAAWFCTQRHRPAAAGLLVALAALLKLFPAGVAGYFLFSRNWRAFAWTIGVFAAGVLITNPHRWLELVTNGLPIAYRISGHSAVTVLSFARQSVEHFSGTRGRGQPLFAVWGLTALIDFALLTIAAALTIVAHGRADLDGILFGLWAALALLMSPLVRERDMLLLLPAYLLGLLAAWQGYRPREPHGNTALLAGGAMLSICILPNLIKAFPHPGFPALLAAYLGAALILGARTREERR